ncbi:MAG: ATP-binding protein [Candidatus Electrothrix sp. GW3-4]|uniref:ATP-binding protein n=1 Tax=Candidatus Electrothrix sp. GW3-4 TaxID=3126740 RepID=UPI0030D590C4
MHIIDTEQKDFTFESEEDKLKHYCKSSFNFAPGQKAAPTKNKIGINKGSYADGSIDKFVRRLETKIKNPRLQFIFGEESSDLSLEDVMNQLMGFKRDKESNITILDLSGIPFEVLSITVSLITRLLFDYGYYFRRSKKTCDTPFLLVYEEAHKYAPRSGLARYKASLSAIERIAKEGRKYGVSLLIASQRPSEISETIFSQCSNFLAMRLTNPDDQNYVRRLLPDTLGNITEGLPSLEAGEALLIGEATVMPSVVYVTPCAPEPSSSDIPYFDIWQDKWRGVKLEEVTSEWKK